MGALARYSKVTNVSQRCTARTRLDLHRGLLHWSLPNVMTNRCWGGRRAAVHLFGRDLRPLRHRIFLPSSHSHRNQNLRGNVIPHTRAQGEQQLQRQTQPNQKIASFEHARGAHPHGTAQEPCWPPQTWRAPPSLRALLARAVDAAGHTAGSTQDLPIVPRPNVLVGVAHCGRDPLDRVALAALAHDKLAPEQRLRVGARGRARERQPGQRDGGEHVEHLHSAKGRAEPHAPADRQQNGNVREQACAMLCTKTARNPQTLPQSKRTAATSLTSLYIQRQFPHKKSSWPLVLTRPACPPHTGGNAWHQGAGRWTATRWQDEHNHHPPSVAGVYVRVRLALPRLLAARGQIPALRCRVVRASTALGAHSPRPRVRPLHAVEHARRAGPAMLPVAGRRHLYHHQPSPLQGPSPCAGIQHHHGACLRSRRKAVRSTRFACASKSSASHER